MRFSSLFLVPHVLAAVLLAAMPLLAHDVIYQYRLPMTSSTRALGSAYLWVPPQATTLRGVILGGSVLCEGRILAHPAVREACIRESLAVIYWSSHPFSTLSNPDANGAWITAQLAEFAQLSGHPELAHVPWMPIGHSVGTVFAASLLAWKPERTFACLTFKGGFALKLNRTAEDLAGIPILHVQGQFEEFGPGENGVLAAHETREAGWNAARDQLQRIRAQSEGLLAGLVVDVGSTHYALNEPVAQHIAGFIAEAAHLRIGTDGALKKVPVTAGAWADGGVLQPKAKAAADAAFSGDKKTAFWHPSAALASGAETLHLSVKDKKPQYVSVTDPNGKLVPVSHDMRIKLPVKWEANGEFIVGSGFWTEVPRRYPAQDGPVGNAGTPPSVVAMAGPIEALGNGRFRPVADTRYGDRAFVLAVHPGNAEYRRAEQQALINEIILPKPGVKPANKPGRREQVISATLPGKLRVAQFPLKLAGTADSGLPVSWHVDAGPARVVDGAVVLADIPEKSKGKAFTLHIIAGQMGDKQTAPAEALEFMIEVAP